MARRSGAMKFYELMKSNLSKVLVGVGIVLAIGLAATKWSDNAQLDTAATAINDYSNRLDTAQAQISIRDGNLITLSNTLAETTTDILQPTDGSPVRRRAPVGTNHQPEPTACRDNFGKPDFKPERHGFDQPTGGAHQPKRPD